MKNYFKILILLFTIYNGSVSIAQNIYISNEEKLSSELEGFDVVGRMNGGDLVVYKKYKYKDELEFYDAQMTLRRKKEITVKAPEYQSKEVLKIGNQIFHFYTKKENKQTFLIAQVFGEDADRKGEPIIIDSTSRRIGDNFSDYTILRSGNGAFAMAYQYEFGGGKISKLLSAVINSTGKITSVNVVDMPTANFDATNEKSLVSNAGIPIFLFSNKEYSCKKEKAEVSYIIACGTVKDSYIIAYIKEEDCMREMQLDVDNHTNTITAIGFTGDQNKNSMTGYVFLQIDPFDGEILNRNAEQFSPELLSSISSKTDKSEKYIPVYKPMQIIPRADGGALLVSEYFQKTTENYDFTNYDPYYGYRTSTREVDYYEYNDVFLISISPLGTIDWTNIIRKRQVSKEDRGAYSSFVFANCIERLFFIYNEDISQNSNVIQYEMLADGTLNRKSLFNPSKQEVELRPQAGKQVAFNEVIIPSIHKRNLAFISIEF
ncbi:MAG: hypothetical protein IPH61_04715 [Bacteroidetes bacterium]|nr:hypothetical protein [Bacteroidota bacterium]